MGVKKKKFRACENNKNVILAIMNMPFFFFFNKLTMPRFLFKTGQESLQSI